jgi:hypothetical protein
VETFLARCASYFAPPSAYPNLPEDPAELLDFAFERDVAMYEFLWESRGLLRTLATNPAAHERQVAVFRAAIDETSRQWTEHYKAEGWFRDDVDVDLATALVSGAYNQLTLVMLAAGDQRPPLEDWLSFAQLSFARAFGSTELLRVIDARSRRSNIEVLVRAARAADR